MHLLLPGWHDLHENQKRRNIEIDVSIGGPRVEAVAAVRAASKRLLL